jgi:hypothetical protein
LGAANALRDTSSLISRNENDSARLPTKTTSCSPNQLTHLLLSRKVLNLCEDSKSHGTVTFLPVAQNKFINWLRSNESEAIFPTTHRHYADK